MAAGSGNTRELSMEPTNAKTPTKLDLLDQLHRYQTKEKDLAEHRIKQARKFRDDYITLKSQLAVIANRLTHPVMVPFGPKAFFPGQLKHTNEILVLLGDNWFAERSAKQAVEIVDRRLKQCDGIIKQCEEQLKLTENWRDTTNQMIEASVHPDRGIEIFEDEEEEGWREKHRQKVREYKKKLAEMREKDKTTIQTEEDLWARLDELELEEELQDQLAQCDDKEYESNEEVEEEEEEEDEEEIEQTQDTEAIEEMVIIKESENTDYSVIMEEKAEKMAEVELGPVSSQTSDETSLSLERKKVTWSTSDYVRRFHNDEVLTRPEEDSPDTLRLTFKHSKTPKKRAKFSQLPEETAESTESASVVSSPSDIYQRFYGASEEAEPKSILKVKKSTTPIRPEADPEVEESLPVAVLEDVFERAPIPVVQEAPESTEQINTHRPVSRFKASRMNRRL